VAAADESKLIPSSQIVMGFVTGLISHIVLVVPLDVEVDAVVMLYVYWPAIYPSLTEPRSTSQARSH
jgi:hypothetical protein